MTLRFLFCYTLIFYTAQSVEKLAFYKKFIEEGTYSNQDFSFFGRIPASRYETFKFAFENFEKNKHTVIVELGTTRSFMDGRFEGCNKDDERYWKPNNPEYWDWGAGCFTRLAAECLGSLNPTLYTVDLERSHLTRCRIITKDFSSFINYIVSDSVEFLSTFNKKIDLLYIDTGDMWPIETTAVLQLEEAKMIVKRDLIGANGLILIDDVMNSTPKKFGEKSDLGKAKYSIPYFLDHGFEIVMGEYQYILKKK